MKRIDLEKEIRNQVLSLTFVDILNCFNKSDEYIKNNENEIPNTLMNANNFERNGIFIL